jgi:hypothetical protein
VKFAETRLPLWAHVLDAIAIILIFLGLYVAIEGGFVLWPRTVRLSVRSEWRVFIWAALIIAIRHYRVRHLPLHRRIISGVAAAARAAGPLRDDVAPATAPSRARHRVLSAIGVLLVYAALTAVMTWPQVRELGRGVSIDIGDPLLSTWRMAWVAHQVPRDPLNLYNANIFHPERGTLAFSDAMIVPSLTAAPLLWLGVHQITAYNLLFLSGFALSGAGMFLLMRSLTGHAGAAFVSGFVFAFLPYRFMHYAHLELQMAQWMPLCLWAIHRTIQHGRQRDGLMAGLFLALQTLSSWYYGIFLATYLVPVGTALLIAAGRERFRRALRPLVLGAILSAIIVAPFAGPYLDARRAVGERPDSEIEFYSATPINYLAAHPRNALLGRVTAHWGAQERELFQGIAVPLTALVGLWPPLSTARIAYAIGLAFAFDVSLGFNGLFHPWLHAYVLPYRGLRVPARMAIIVGLSLAILAGYGVARICRHFKRGYASATVLAAVLAVFFVEYRSRLPLAPVWRELPPVYGALRDHPDSVLVELPIIAPDIAIEPIYMYFSTFHWHKLVNGYSGFHPRSYGMLLQAMAGFPNEESLAELRRRDVDFVIVHGALFKQAVKYDELIARIDQSADLVPIGTFPWPRRQPGAGRPTRLYRLLPQAGD